ncbi:NUDIX hydrolase [Exilibacterium tricleocarpae]|uniref:NUDIX hydrolase n=1 Tax=Exilibacterium tricleocarpae TaxID=2591008 RepID=A0A545U8E0_9GAMM|nr:NUDIX hydrolase [Exilibacterium tricleocarpae]TQV85736.1 NUDIX hydrolase [Exilibacterium tricleocarpae]
MITQLPQLICPVKLLAPAVCLLFLTGCAADFTCSTPANPLPGANAGCLVIHDKKLLVIQQRSGRWSLPGGSSGRGEAAQCTAQRETWEETGLAVEVGNLVRVFNNGFHLFRCSAAGPHATPHATPNPSDRGEVKAVRWLPADQFQQLSWRFPEQAAYLQQLLTQEP